MLEEPRRKRIWRSSSGTKALASEVVGGVVGMTWVDVFLRTRPLQRRCGGRVGGMRSKPPPISRAPAGLRLFGGTPGLVCPSQV